MIFSNYFIRKPFFLNSQSFSPKNHQLFFCSNFEKKSTDPKNQDLTLKQFISFELEKHKNEILSRIDSVEKYRSDVLVRLDSLEKQLSHLNSSSHSFRPPRPQAPSQTPSNPQVIRQAYLGSLASHYSQTSPNSTQSPPSPSPPSPSPIIPSTVPQPLPEPQRVKIGPKTIDHSSGIRVTIPYGDNLITASDQEIHLWDLAKEEIINTFEGHTGYVRCLKLRNNKGQLISGSDDNSIKLWDISSGQCVATLEGHNDFVLCIELLSDNRLISGSWNGNIKIWDLETGHCLQTFHAHEGYVWDLHQVSSHEFASCSGDTDIRVWSLKTENCVRVLKGHKDGVHCLEYLPKKNLLVSGSKDKTIKLWDLGTGECVNTLRGHEDWVSCLFSPDEGYGSRKNGSNYHELLLSGSDDTVLRVWNLKSGNCVKSLTGHTHYITSITGLPSGEIVTSSTDKTIRVWELDDKK